MARVDTIGQVHRKALTDVKASGLCYQTLREFGIDAPIARLIGVGQGGASDRIAKKMFFSEEKNQKTFISQMLRSFRPWPESWYGGEAKVFCFFSSEKKRFPVFSAPGKISDMWH